MSALCNRIGCKNEAIAACAGCGAVGYCSDLHSREHWVDHIKDCNVSVAENPSAVWAVEEEIGRTLGETEEQWVPSTHIHAYMGRNGLIGQSVSNDLLVSLIAGEADFKQDNDTYGRLPGGGAHRGQKAELYIRIGDMEATIPDLIVHKHSHKSIRNRRSYNVYLTRREIEETGQFKGTVSPSGRVAVGLGTREQKSLIWGNYSIRNKPKTAWQKFKEGVKTGFDRSQHVRIKAFDKDTNMMASLVLQKPQYAVKEGSDRYILEYVEIFVPSSYSGGHSPTESWRDIYDEETGQVRDSPLPPVPAPVPADEEEERPLPPIPAGKRIAAGFIDHSSLTDVQVLNDALSEVFYGDGIELSEKDAATIETVQNLLSAQEAILSEDPHAELSPNVMKAIRQGEELLVQRTTPESLGQLLTEVSERLVDSFELDETAQSISSRIMEKATSSSSSPSLPSIASALSPGKEIAPLDPESVHDMVALMDVLTRVQSQIKSEVSALAADNTVHGGSEATVAELNQKVKSISQIQAVLHQHVQNLAMDETGEVRYDETPQDVYRAVQDAEGILHLERSVGTWARSTFQRFKDRRAMSRRTVPELINLLEQQVKEAEFLQDNGRVGSDNIRYATDIEEHLRTKRRISMASDTRLADLLRRLQTLKNNEREVKRGKRMTTRRERQTERERRQREFDAAPEAVEGM